MKIGTRLFNDLSLRRFSALGEEIATLQGKIATGRNPVRPSLDPVAASRLSAAQDMRAQMARFSGNTARANERLSQADVALGETAQIMARLRELTIRASSDALTTNDWRAIRVEAQQLRGTLFDLANTRDAQGHSLFSGFRVQAQAFVETPDGSIRYAGDRGQHQLRVSETARLATGLDGASVFGAATTPSGPQSVFDIADRLIAALTEGGSLSGQVQADTGRASLRLETARDPVAWRFSLSGPLGHAEIAASLIHGLPGPLVEAINAASARTGVTAELAEGDNRIVLQSLNSGPIILSGLTTGPGGTAPPVPGQRAMLQPIGPDGAERGPVQPFRDARLALEQSLVDIEAAGAHLSLQRARIGALANAATHHERVLTDRQVQLDQLVSGIEDTDIAAAVTELQTRLLNRQAGQQVFAKISQQSLLDFLR
ncbi:flagellar hook-associated protein FlgL [Plastorhodobacter daqingensis]|uniref:Flagellar hook-associated protein FlgL n=1 Tax=Plastorhodobacter daqingensis TaxID=1387281 RepID=A0ABW2UG44_9RHOB